MVFRLNALLSRRLLLSDPQAGGHHFQPVFGLGVSHWVPGSSTAQQVLDDTEQRALAQVQAESPREAASTSSASLTAASPLS